MCTSRGNGGSGSGGFTSSDKTIMRISPESIETTVGGNLRLGIFNATAEGNGEIYVKEADYSIDSDRSSRKYEVRHYKTEGAYLNVGGDSGEYSDNRDKTTSKGINWDNVTAVSGATYSMRKYLKGNGFKWDNGAKKWVK